MVNSTCGVPPTVTGSLKSTVTSMASPAMKAPPAPCAPGAGAERVSPVTVGTTTSARAGCTNQEPEATACVPRPSAAELPAPSAIVPPFSASAEAPMTRLPFGSAATTV